MNISMPEEVGFMCYRLQGARPAPLDQSKLIAAAPCVSSRCACESSDMLICSQAAFAPRV